MRYTTKNEAFRPIMAWLLLLTLAGAFIPACVSFETNAYRTIGTTATLVDQSMNAWGDYVRAGLATPADETRVKTVYQHYQRVMATAKVSIANYRSNPQRTPMEQALSAVETTAADLVAMIRQYTTTTANQNKP